MTTKEPDISSLQKYLTSQPDRAEIAKMDAKLAQDEEVKRRTASDKARRNIKK